VNLSIRLRQLWEGLGLMNEMDNLVGAIRGAFHTEHREDDSHGNIHAQTIETGRIVFSDIVTPPPLLGGLFNNYDPNFGSASLLRLNPSTNHASMTGLMFPQDEQGAVLDGRVICVENVGSEFVIVLEHEHTGSFPRNRFEIPFAPVSTTGATNRFFIFPHEMVFLIYNANVARWRVMAGTNDQIAGYAEFGSNQNDYSPVNFLASRVLRLVPTAANLTISGFAAAGFVQNRRVTVQNDGLFRFAILHMNTGSVAANRVVCPGGTRYYINPREAIELEFAHDGQWHVLQSGKALQWIDVPFAAGNFTASGGGTWTVAAGDVATLGYMIDGDMMTVAWEINTSDVGGGPAALQILIPAGRVAARNMSNKLSAVINAGVNSDIGWSHVLAGGTIISLFTNTAGTPWTNTAGGNTFAYGQIMFKVEEGCGTITELHTDAAHGDTAHADAEHSDVAHADVAHVDSHSDAAHADAAHSDTAHSDAHGDVAFSDVAHQDVTHVDGAHQDAHSDTAHADFHDDSHTDEHQDFDDTGFHDDTHGDVGHVDQHGDTAHVDTHSDASHGDTSHADVAHADTVHTDTHSDTAHADAGHTDSAHGDTHSDAVHSDVVHVDGGHSDTVHIDTPHADVGYHCDTAHADV